MNPTFNKSNLQRMIVLMFTIISANLMAQPTYTQQGVTKLTVSGTSTMHNWTMVSAGAVCTAVFELNHNGKPTRLSILSVTLPTQSLKSGKSAMDKNAHTALKADKNKTISFNLMYGTITSNVIRATGNMTVAGTSREIDVEAIFTVGTDNSIQVKGFKKLLMTEYNVEPPSFMFGSVKTGDEIILEFDVTLVPARRPSINLN